MSIKTVQDDVSRFGLRRIHLVNTGDRAIDPPLPEGWRVVDTLAYVEEEIGVSHLWLFMKKDENAKEAFTTPKEV